MLFPIGDDNRERTIFPFINYLLIITNIFVFIYLQDWGNNAKLTLKYATVPEEILSGRDIVTSDQTFENPVTGEIITNPGLGTTPVSVYITLFTSLFLHGSIAHIFGNMLFLWIFGDNIENKVGHLRYLIFYLLCGVLASLANVYATLILGANLLIPTIGASGAISGVLGAYLLLFPRKRVSVIVFFFITDMPAIAAIGIWFLFQLISGIGLLGSGAQGSGIAYGAHIGGFISGMLLIKFFLIGRRQM